LQCDGKRPNCSACVAIGHACSYDPSTKKRGLPEGYVRGLEKLWALCIGKIEGLEETVIQLMQHQDEIKSVWNHETVGEELHGSWKESSILHELEGLLSKVEATELAGKRKRDREESDSEGTPGTTFHRTLEYAIVPYGVPAGPKSGAPFHGSTASDSRSQFLFGPLKKPNRASAVDSGNGDPISSTILPFPARTPVLLDLYFSHTHCWFPILERHHILRISYSCSTNQQENASIRSADLATLWALLAYVDKQDVHVAPESRVAGEIDSSEMLAAAMRSIPPFEDGVFELGHVQALLLVALNCIGSQWNRAWLVVGHAVRIAMNINVGEIASRGKHVLFGCFILDTLVSARLDRRPHMRREDIEPFGHLEEDGLEEWDPWTNSIASLPAEGVVRGPAFEISCFNKLCDVYAILNDIICCTSSGIDRRTFCLKQSERLESLFRKLPFPNLGVNMGAAQQQSPPHKTYLVLSYFTTLLALNLFAREASHHRLSDAFARDACEILVLLTQHAQSVGLAVLPPFLEYAMRLSFDGAILARSQFGDTIGLPTFAFWVHKMSEHINAIKSLWPVFNSLGETLAEEERRERRSFTLPTTPTIFRANEMVPTPTSIPAPTDKQTAPHLASGIILHPTLNFWEATSSSAITLAIDQVPAAFDMMMTDMTTPTPSNQSMPAGLAMPVTSQTSPSFHADDVDAIFHDLAHLDTTEWTNDREQGLREFGFADDSTFQAFCNDPDRLVNRTTPFDPSPMDDNTTNLWPPPGFFPDTFGEPDPHMEASQILQSLSANDQYPKLPESIGW
jgi:Fungal specific transcription factor domain